MHVLGFSGMPVEVLLELVADRDALLPRFTGHISRGLFLHILRQVDPGLSFSLHQPNVRKPYSVTPLMFKPQKRIEEGKLLEMKTPCWVSFRFLKDDLAQKFIKFFYRKTEVLIFDVEFHVNSITIKTKEYGELEREAEEPVGKIKLIFKSPTYLTVSGTDYHYLFPDHVKVFLHLMRLWNEFTSTRKFSEEELNEYGEWLFKNVGVAAHRLGTVPVVFKERPLVGFTGWVIYEIKDESGWNNVTQMLAMFAEYSNIGGNRTGGFGVTKHTKL